MIKHKIQTLTKFSNLLIKKGKKAKSLSLVLNTLFLLKKKTKKNPLNLITTALRMLTPGVTTKKTVIAGRLYHLPSAITKNKALYFSCNWLQKSAKDNKELQKKTLDQKLAEECQRVLNKKAGSLTLLKQHNKVVSENRSFLRFVRKKRKPFLPRKVWLRKKQLLWLSRRKKIKPKFSKMVDFSLNPKTYIYDKKTIVDTRKYAVKKVRKVSKLFKSFENKILKRIEKKKKLKLERQKLKNPRKFQILQKVRKIILKRVKDKHDNTKQNKKFNKKNKFQSRSKFRANNKS